VEESDDDVEDDAECIFGHEVYTEATESEKYVHCTKQGHEEYTGDVQSRCVCDSLLQ
jgi:hypothetical protein